jgi:ribosomal protein S18 acetylase RimI-like enzyme
VKAENIGTAITLAKRPFPEPENAAITLRPITDDDLEFLFQLYASTRTEEKALAGWGDEQWEQFIRMQFNLQHTQYLQNYRHPSFQIVLEDTVPVGRLYIDRRADEYRLVDIAVLPEFQRRGIAGRLMRELLLEADEHALPVSLHVERNNPILGYYQKAGFRIEEDKGVYFFMVRPPSGNKISA